MHGHPYICMYACMHVQNTDLNNDIILRYFTSCKQIFSGNGATMKFIECYFVDIKHCNVIIIIRNIFKIIKQHTMLYNGIKSMSIPAVPKTFKKTKAN